MRKAFPATPVASKEAQDRYVDFCSKYRAAVMAVKDKTGAQTFLETFLVGEGYWSSTIEMFARAFDCYVEDKLKSAHMRSDYLSSHASAYSVYVEGKDGKREKVYAIPQGAERKALNKKFDELIKQLKDMGVFHITDSKPVFTPSSSGIAAGKPVPATKPKRTKRTHTQEETVQLTFEDLLSVAK